MSAPICGWAFNTGRARKLSPSERLVLWALAEHCNGGRAAASCWPSIVLLMDDTGLSKPTVLTVVKSLVGHGLITVTRRGRGQEYHLPLVKNDTQSNGTNRSNPLPSQTTGQVKSVTQSPVKKHDATGKKTAPGPVKNVTPNLLKEPLKEPVAREEARSGAASGPEPGREDFSGGSGAPPAPPVPLATPGSDTFNSYLDDPAPTKALPCEIEQDVIHADPLDLPVDPEYVRATVAALRHEWRMRAYPARATDLSRSEQSDLCQDKPSIRTAYLPDAVLRLQRQQLAERAAHRA